MHVKVWNLSYEQSSNTINSTISRPGTKPKTKNTKQMMRNQWDIRQSVINACKKIINAIRTWKKYDKSL